MIGGDIGAGQRCQVEEAGQHAHVEQDRLGVADHRRDARRQSPPRGPGGSAGCRRPGGGRGLADQQHSPSPGRSPPRPSAGPAGSRHSCRRSSSGRRSRPAARPDRPAPRRPPTARRRRTRPTGARAVSATQTGPGHGPRGPPCPARRSSKLLKANGHSIIPSRSVILPRHRCTDKRLRRGARGLSNRSASVPVIRACAPKRADLVIKRRAAGFVQMGRDLVQQQDRRARQGLRPARGHWRGSG